MSNSKRTKLTENEIDEWWATFGPPPVLSSENKDGYYKLRNACVAHYQPSNDRHWAWIRELVDTQWEILRHLRYRTAAIKRHEQIRISAWRKKVNQMVETRKHELSKLYLPFGDLGHESVVSLQKNIATLEALLQENAQRKPDDVEQSLDLEKAVRFAEKLDKWLKNGTARRNILLKILEYYCRPIDRETKIPAPHYNDLKQDELKQITASPFVLATSLHVTTEDQPETVAAATEPQLRGQG